MVNLHTFSLLLFILCASCARETQTVEQALLSFLKPDASVGTVRQELARLADTPDPQRLFTTLGSNNLTVILLTMPKESKLTTSNEYEWDWPEKDLRKLGMQLSREASAVAASDIHNLLWHISGDGHLNGSFSIDTTYGLQARFLFRGQQHGTKYEIDTLSVARVGSHRLEDAFPLIPARDDSSP